MSSSVPMPDDRITPLGEVLYRLAVDEDSNGQDTNVVTHARELEGVAWLLHALRCGESEDVVTHAMARVHPSVWRWVNQVTTIQAVEH